MNFESFLVDFLNYLKESEGFITSGDIPAFILTEIHSSSADITSEEEIMNIIRSAVCKNPEQYIDFPEIFSEYYKNEKRRIDEINKTREKADALKNKLETIREKEREDIKKNTEERNFIFDNIDKRDAFLRKAKKHEGYLKELINGGKLEKETKELANLFFFDKQCETFPDGLLSQMLSELLGFAKSAAFEAAMAGKKPVVDILKTAKDSIEKIKKSTDKELSPIQNGPSEAEIIQKQLEQAMEELGSLQSAEIVKSRSLNHRQSFIGGKNSIKSRSKGEPMLDKRLDKVSNKDMKMLQHYIKKNATKFKTKISRNIGTSRKESYDMKNIIKKACSSDGIPMKLLFKKPVQNKPELVLILDISGSCSHASKLMLLFMYYLKQAFAGGCRAYVFVNYLYDVTSFLNTKTPLQAVDSILKSIPTRGVYSDYDAPFRYFYKNNMETINKDSIVVFIGDARNNANPTGEKYIEAISRKSRACFWLNTEEETEWNTGDSIISCYAKYMQDVLPVLTVGQLIDFITNFKIRKGVFYGK